jgi:hypothetical protein
MTAGVWVNPGATLTMPNTLTSRAMRSSEPSSARSVARMDSVVSRVRGALERTYVLRLSSASIGLDEVAAMNADEHRQAFLAYVAGLLGDFDRYLDRGDIDLLRDGVSYRMAGLWLDDAEFADLMRDIVRVLQPRLAKPPAPGRTRRILYSILLPGTDSPGTGTPGTGTPGTDTAS